MAATTDAAGAVAVKRTPLARGKPLRRKRPIRRRRLTPRRSDRAYDSPYVAFIRRQPCAVSAIMGVAGDCTGRVDPDHTGRRPAGRKADDRTCIPLCRKHHRARDQFSGFFRDWSRDTMRTWLDRCAWYYRDTYLRKEP